MRILYKQFEIIATNATNFEVVLWYDSKCSTTNTTIAKIVFDKRSSEYSIASVGMRLVNNYQTGLAEFISAFIEFQQKLRLIEESENLENYEA